MPKNESTQEKALTVLLAEYTMLSQEMEYILKSLANRVTLVISAIGIFAAVTYSGRTSLPEELFLIGVPRLVYVFGILYMSGMYLVGVHALRRSKIEDTVNKWFDRPVMQWDSIVVPKTYHWKTSPERQASALLAFVLVGLWITISALGVAATAKESPWWVSAVVLWWSLFEIVSMLLLCHSKSLGLRKAKAAVDAVAIPKWGEVGRTEADCRGSAE